MTFDTEKRQPNQLPTETGWWYASDSVGGNIYPHFVQKFKNGKFRVESRVQTDLVGWWYRKFPTRENYHTYTWYGPVLKIEEK